MTTPTKKAIIEKAIELWKTDQLRSGSMQLAQLNPEVEELREGGYLSAAQSELMRDKYKAEIEGKDFYDLENLEVKELAEVLDLKEALASGIYISGTSGHGKSDLAMYIADWLMQNGVTVIAIDSSQDWVCRSSIPKVQTVTNAWIDKVSENSIIYDISLLTIPERQSFAENLCRILYETQALTSKEKRREFFLVFEEAHTYLTEAMLRSKKGINIQRLLTEGRNYNVRFACITQFASLISKTAMKFMRMRFFGYADEPNDVKFISGFLGSEHVKKLRNLDHGSFIAYSSGKLSLIHIEPYEATVQKEEIPQLSIEPTQQLPKTDAKAWLSFASFMLWIIAMLWVVVR